MKTPSLFHVCQASLLLGMFAWLGQAGAAEDQRLADLRGVWQARCNGDGSRVLVRMRRGELGLWDAESGRAVKGDLEQVTMKLPYFVEPTGRRFVASVGEGAVRVFDMTTGMAISPPIAIELLETERGSPAFSPDLSQVLLFDQKQQAQVFEVKSGQRIARLTLEKPNEDYDESGLAAKFAKDRPVCFVITNQGVLRRYDATTWKLAGEPMTHPNREGWHFSFNLSEDGQHAVTSDGPGENGPKGYLQLWDTQTSRPLGQALEATNGVSGRFLPSGKRLVVSPARGRAGVHEVPSLKRLFDLPEHDDVEGPKMKATPDGKGIFTWGYSGSVIFSDATTGKHLGSSSNRALLKDVLVTPDSKRAFLVYDNTAFLLQQHYDQYVIQVSLPDFEVKNSLRILGYLASVDLSPEGSRLIVIEGVTGKEQVRLFDATTLKETGLK